MPRRRVVVTGMGVLAPNGNSIPEYWGALRTGTSGIGPITHFDTTDYTVRIAGELTGFNAEDHLEHKEIRKLDRFALYALVAAAEAIEQAHLTNDGIDPERVGVIIGSGIGGIETFEEQHQIMLEKGPRRISPFFIPKMIANIAAGHVAIKWGFKGPNHVVVSACASGSDAIGEALRAIQYGDADVMITGGAEASVCPMAVAGFANMKALSTRNDDPVGASRPFDAERDGFVIAEGSGILVLEELEHARSRGATILAEVAGYGATDDAFHVTQPAAGGTGAAEAMRLAICDAGLPVTAVDYINAHGTSTPYNDKNETAAIKTVFGEHTGRLLVSSTKSMTGHLLGASGGIEAIAAILAINNDLVPPTINQTTPDPECDLNYVPNQAVASSINVAISNSLGFGGHNAVLLIKRWSN
ncbi:MAG: beta-ketoacyl-ACP synthase II [Candidatus Neomarinimicrobiota bacterium]